METNIQPLTDSAATIADTAEPAAPEPRILGMRKRVFFFYLQVLIVGSPIALSVGLFFGWLSTIVIK